MRIPKPALWTRWLTVFWAITVFYWLGLEDTTLWPVVMLGMASAIVIIGLWTFGRYGGQRIARNRVPYWAGLIGVVVGLGGTIVTALLMLFKNVRHAHILPDYPFELIIATLTMAPIWAISAGVLAFSIAFFWKINTQEQPIVTRLYLVRHGETDWNAQRRFQGQADRELNAIGHQQAEKAAERIAALPETFTTLYASPLTRTIQTAEPIAQKLSLPILPAPEIKEIHCGKWEGMVAHEIDAAYPGELATWRANITTHVMPEGESVTQMQERGIPFYQRLQNEHPGEAVIVVGHGASLLAMICYFVGWELAPTWANRDKRLINTGLTILHLNEDGKNTVERFNWLGQ